MAIRTGFTVAWTLLVASTTLTGALESSPLTAPRTLLGSVGDMDLFAVNLEANPVALCIATTIIAHNARNAAPPPGCNTLAGVLDRLPALGPVPTVWDVFDDAAELLQGHCPVIVGDCSVSVSTTCSDGSLGITSNGQDLVCGDEAMRQAKCRIVPLLPPDLQPPIAFPHSCAGTHPCTRTPAVAATCTIISELLDEGLETYLQVGKTVSDATTCPRGVTVPVVTDLCRDSGSSEPVARPPRPNGTYCEDRKSTEAAGKWNIVMPTASFPSETPSPAGLGAFASLSLSIPDQGTNSQRICFVPGAWSPVVPPTRQPPSESEIRAKERECAASRMLIIGGVGVAAVGAIAAYLNPASPAAWTAVATGVGMVVTGATMQGACAEAEDMRSDVGYMRCQGHAKVTWGGPGGNAFDSTILAVGAISLDTHSDGPGYYEENYPPLGTYLYDAPGYWEGQNNACPNNMEAANEAAWSRFVEYMDTTSTTTEATASLTLHAHLANTGAVLEQVFRVAPGILLSTTGHLVFACPDARCDLDVSVSVTSCGQQVATANGNEIVYDFIGASGCTMLVVTVNGQSVPITVPLLRLDGHFGGEGNTILGGGGLEAMDWTR